MRLLTLGTLVLVLAGTSLSSIAKPRVAGPGTPASKRGRTSGSDRPYHYRFDQRGAGDAINSLWLGKDAPPQPALDENSV